MEIIRGENEIRVNLPPAPILTRRTHPKIHMFTPNSDQEKHAKVPAPIDLIIICQHRYIYIYIFIYI